MHIGCAELQAGKLPINQPGSEESFEPTIQNSALPRRSQRLLCGLSRRHAQEPLSTLRLNRGLGVGRKNPALEAHGSDNHALDNARHEKCKSVCVALSRLIFISGDAPTARPTSGRVLLHKPRRKWPTQDDPIEVGDDESIKGIPKPPVCILPYTASDFVTKFDSPIKDLKSSLRMPVCPPQSLTHPAIQITTTTGSTHVSNLYLLVQIFT